MQPILNSMLGSVSDYRQVLQKAIKYILFLVRFFYYACVLLSEQLKTKSESEIVYSVNMEYNRWYKYPNTRTHKRSIPGAV